VKRAGESADPQPITPEIPLTGGRTTAGVVRVGDIGEDEWKPEVQARRLARFFAQYGAAPAVLPVQTVLDAQTRLCNKDGVHQAWAERCRVWTERHRCVLSDFL
jgi:hypothetical protein